MVIPDATWPVFSPDGRWLLVRYQEKEKPLRWDLWSLAQGKRLASFPLKQVGEYWPAFSPDGNRLAIPEPDAVRLYDVPGGQELHVLNHKCTLPIYDNSCVLFARGNANTRTVFAPDGKTLATGGDDGKVKLWNVATGQLSATLGGHSQPYTFVRYSPEGKRLLTGSIGLKEVIVVAPGLPGKPTVTAKVKVIDRSAGEVILWDAATLAKQHTLALPCPLSLAWSPDGKILAASNQNQIAVAKLQLWDVAGGRPLGTWPGFDGAQFAADGKTMLTFDFGHVVVWDLEIVPTK
jgi:WD40 repeat protein